MSEEQDNDRKLYNLFKMVTEETFLNYLKHVGVNEVKCQVCGNTKMAIPNVSDNGEDPYLIPIDTEEVSYKNKYWITNYKYRFICRNCGHETYFNAWPVSDWLTKQRKECEDEGE